MNARVPTKMRRFNSGKALRVTASVGVFLQNVSRKPFRTGQVDVQVPNVRMLHLQPHIAYILRRLDGRRTGKAREGEVRPVGASVRPAWYAVGEEGDGRVGERGLRQDILQVVARQRPDNHRLRVPGHYLFKIAVHNGVFGFEHVETDRHGGTSSGIIGGDGVKARFPHGDGCGCVARIPKVGLRFGIGDRSERRGGVRTEELRAGNRDGRCCNHRQTQSVRTGTTLAVGVFVNIHPAIRVD